MNTKSEPTDSGRVGDEVAEKVLSEFFNRDPSDDVWPPEEQRRQRVEAMRAALEAALAAQGQGERCKPCGGMGNIMDMRCIACDGKGRTRPAPAASPAGVPDVVSIMAHLPDNRAATRAELIRAFRLTAAPSAPEGDGGEGWRIDTDDDVERIANIAGWDNRRYMTQADYAVWCERMREFVKLASTAPSDGGNEVKDSALLDWLEEQARNSQTGISFDYCKYTEDGHVIEKGYRFMRRHFLGERKPTLREAIVAAQQPTQPAEGE